MISSRGLSLLSGSVPCLKCLQTAILFSQEHNNLIFVRVLTLWQSPLKELTVLHILVLTMTPGGGTVTSSILQMRKQTQSG